MLCLLDGHLQAPYVISRGCALASARDSARRSPYDHLPHQVVNNDSKVNQSSCSIRLLMMHCGGTRE